MLPKSLDEIVRINIIITFSFLFFKAKAIASERSFEESQAIQLNDPPELEHKHDEHSQPINSVEHKRHIESFNRFSK